MNHCPEFVLAVSTLPGPAAGPISLTEILLLLGLGGVLVIILQLRRLQTRLDALEQRLAGALPRTEGARVVPAPAAPAPAPAPLPRVDDAAPSETLAAVVAAVYAAVGVRARIVSIATGAEAKQVWSLEGRRQIFASHQVR